MNRSPLSATSPVSALASRRARWVAPWLGAACLLVVGSPHLAAQAWESCLEDAVVEADLRACARARAERATAAMDSVYRQLAARLDPERRALLEGVQHRWLAYRDAHCDYVAAPQVGASLHRNVIDTCRARLAERRARELIGAAGAVENDAGAGSERQEEGEAGWARGTPDG